VSKESVKAAMDRHLAKLEPKPKASKRRNRKPEKQVEKVVMSWLRQHGFSCHVVESKAIFSPSRGSYLRGQTVPGFSDIAGCCSSGYGCFIELKAPGKRSTVSDAQLAFLTEKIKRGAFAVVTDSTEHLELAYMAWFDLREDNIRLGCEFLMDDLPKKRQRDNDLF